VTSLLTLSLIFCCSTVLRCPNLCGVNCQTIDMRTHLAHCFSKVNSCIFARYGCQFQGTESSCLNHVLQTTTVHAELVWQAQKSIKINVLKWEMASIQASREFSVFVRTLCGKSLVLPVRSGYQVQFVKLLIAKRESINPRLFRLTFNSTFIHDSHTLSELGITKDSVLIMLLPRITVGNPGQQEQDKTCKKRSRFV